LQAWLEHVEIRPVGIHHGKIPNFVRTRSEKDLFPVSRPVRVIGIIARDIFENVNFSRGNVDDGDVTGVRRFLVFSVVLNATRVPSGEMAGKMPSAIFFSPVPSKLAIQTA
jgi:hypothetical protein